MQEDLDIKKMLMDELKKEGLEIAEESAKSIFKAVFKVIPKVVVATPNKYDDLLLVVLPIIEPLIMEKLENINPADNVDGGK